MFLLLFFSLLLLLQEDLLSHMVYLLLCLSDLRLSFLLRLQSLFCDLGVMLRKFHRFLFSLLPRTNDTCLLCLGRVCFLSCFLYSLFLVFEPLFLFTNDLRLPDLLFTIEFGFALRLALHSRLDLL